MIEQANQGSDGGHVPDLQSMTVHNRFDFTDLSECKVSWRSLSSSDHDHALDFQNASSLGTSSAEGGVGHASGAPHSCGHKLTLVGLTAATKRVEINVTSPRGFLLNTWRLGSTPAVAGWPEDSILSPSTQAGARSGGGEGRRGGVARVVVRVNTDGSLAITAGGVAWAVSASGSVSATLGQTPLVAAGPSLMVLAIHKSESDR